MHLIVILFCLGLDRFWQSRIPIRKYGWYQSLLQWLQVKLFSKKTLPSIAIMAICLLIVLIPVIFVQVLLRHAYHGIPLFLFHFFVLYYCFGETNFKDKLEHYFKSKSNQDIQAAFESLADSDIPLQQIEKPEDLSQNVSTQLLSLANYNMVAIIFWYLLLGLPGAVLYRFSILLQNDATTCDDENNISSIRSICQQFVEALLWLPARLLGLCYALAGNFMQSFAYWVKHCFDGLSQTDQFLEETGLAATGIHFGKKNQTENPEIVVIDLIDRSLIIVLVLVALLTLGAWLG